MNINVPAWHIVTWPAVQLGVDQWKSLQTFEFVGLSSRLDDDGRHLGNSLWASPTAAGRIGLAWEWCEMNTNVFVMTDPMSVLSNVAFTQPSGAEKTNEFQRILHLNNAVYQIPWQAHLRHIVKQQDSAKFNAIAAT